MKQLITINLTTRTADWAPPVLTFGEDLTIAMRFTKNHEGEEMETSIVCDTLRASIGREDARPLGGSFALKVGAGHASASNTTAALAFDVPASTLAQALQAVPAMAAYGPTVRAVQSDGSWLIFCGAQAAQVPLEVVENSLWPAAFGRVSAVEADGKWTHELRLIQVPVAHTSSHDVVLPPAPSMSRLQEGGSDGGTTWNEIQELYVPPEFRGTYLLKRGYAKTPLLSRDDDPEAIQTALQALGAGNFKVTLPLSYRPNIEFVGDYAGLAHDLLEVQVKQSPPGDLSFTLPLDRAELAAALRRESPVTLPLEVRITGTDSTGASGELVALSVPVAIRRPIIYPELEEMPTIEWLRPTSPRAYVPYAANQILTGNKYYAQVVGDGESTAWVVATGLAGELVDVFVRENFSGGRLLRNGVDYAATIDSSNQVSISALAGAPASGAWVVVVAAAGTVAQWAADLLVTVPQVVAGGGYLSLPDFMDDIGARVERLEALLPRPGNAAVGEPQRVAFALPDVGEVLPDAADLLVGDAAGPTLASQIVVPRPSSGGNAAETLGGTEVKEREETAKREAAQAERDPDALPPNVIYRAALPAVGRPGDRGQAQQKDEAGNVIVPEIAPVEAEPAVWPLRSASMLASGKWPLLLPAISDASVTDAASLPGSMPAWPGAVYRHTGTASLQLPGGLGRKSQVVPTNGLYGSDGRAWYAVALDAASGLYHPTEMERELWRIYVGAEQFPPASLLSATGEIRHRLVGEPFDDDARSLGSVVLGCSYLLRLQVVPVAGASASGAASAPITIGQTRLTLSPALESLRWSATLTRAADGSISGNWRAYGAASGTTAQISVPGILRLVLTAWDVDDSSTNARGQVALVAPAASVEVKTL
jgi:hypothetical protein